MINKAGVKTKNPNEQILVLDYPPYIMCVCAVSTGVHVCKIGNYLPDKGHLPCFSTPVLQFVVKVQLCVWICLCRCGRKNVTKGAYITHAGMT